MHPTEILQSAIESGSITAAALVVERAGETLFAEGYGHLTPDSSSAPVTPDSIFLLASISKPISVLPLMRLVEQGRVDLQAPAHTLLPELTGDGREDIRVSHLLSHVSGMPDMLPNNVALRKAHAPLGEFVAQALKADLLFPPGTDFSYQSKGILLAAEITERLTGQRLRDVLRRDFFEPLGMSDTALGMGDFAIEDTVWCGTSLDETDDQKSWGPNSPYWRDQGHPWGGVHASAVDLSRLMRAMLAGGQTRNGRVLEAATVSEMTRDWNSDLDAPWGLGFGLRDSRVWTPFGDRVSSRTFGHEGATGTTAWADPESDLTCIILTNRRTDGFLDSVSTAVAATFA